MDNLDILLFTNISKNPIFYYAI